MAQKTAVDYYADKQLELHLKLKDNQLLMMDFVVQSRDLLIQSKEMEKKQMIDFANDYIDDDDIRDLTAEEYYNETYKSK
jgi:hypothetical protein